MSMSHAQFICSNCEYSTLSWLGRCPECNQFNTLTAQTSIERNTNHTNRQAIGVLPHAPTRLQDVSTDQGQRWSLYSPEFNRVLGGGLVPGSIILIGGEPGIGKTTLISHAAASLANSRGTVLYVSGEESAAQIKMRADRLNLSSQNLFLLTETNLENILEHVQQLKPILLIIDSIQTTYTEHLTSAPGNPSQIRECATRLQTLAKSSGIPVILIGHVTKDGDIAGPKLLEHIVDTVLYLEGDHYQAFRLLRGVKNRFGATSEVGVFEMHSQGLIEVQNPSLAFLAERSLNSTGSAIAVTMEGTRPLLVELQALNTRSFANSPRRTPNGVDTNRLLMVGAVLTRRAAIDLQQHDIFLNVIGGLRIREPAADLAMAVAVASTYFNSPVPPDIAMIGELGLSGEVRSVAQLPARLNEVAKLGFKRVILPKTRRKISNPPKGLEMLPVQHIKDALRLAVPRFKQTHFP